MQVDKNTFHAAKAKFTRYESWGKGETVGARIIDKLAVKTVTGKETQVTEWYLAGRAKFRAVAHRKQPGDVFPRMEYEIL